MASFPNQEHRPLKRLRLGPIGPEVYPQDKKQKEDEISQSSVKHGFNNMPCIKDEFGSAKDALLNSGGMPLIAKVSTAFNALLSKKQELNTLQDQAKRKPQMMKDNFYPIGIARGKQMSETWLREDLATTKPLSLITKKVPVFNKREDVFQKLCEENIPPYRAAWYIKLANTYNILICDVAKAKKRQVVDPCQEWTVAMTRHLRDQLQKIAEHYNNSSSNASASSTSVVMNTSFLTAGGGAGRQAPPDLGLEHPLRQWNYNCRLVLRLFEDGLLDKQDFLSWLIDQLEKYCGGSRMTQQSNEDAMLKILIIQVVKHMNEFVQSQMLSRRLAHFCCKKLSFMYSDGSCPSAPAPHNESTKGQNNPSNQSTFSTQGSAVSGCNNTTPSTSSSSSGVANNNNNNNGDNNQNNNNSSSSNNNTNHQVATFSECANCPQHRGLLMNLSAIVQAVVISCPAALVWHDLGEGKQFSTLNGSPLDLLPCSPLVLPMPAGDDNKEIREMLMMSEGEIIHRSEMSESKWSVDKQRQTNTGILVNYILSCLEALDRHAFDKVDNNNNNGLDNLFNKIFANHSIKDGPEHFSIDEPVVNLLCEWAVTTKRSGIHRTVVVAKLLERYQNHVMAEKSSDADPSDDKDAESNPSSSYSSSSSHPPFQVILFNFLDEKAPFLDENPSSEARAAFSNLILLFCELIRHEIFSHDVYVSTLIARGDLMNATSILPIVQNYHVPESEGHGKTESSSKQENSDAVKMEVDEFSIFENKDEVRPSPDQPASVRSLLDQQCLLPSSMPPCIARTPGAPMTPVNLRTSAPHTPSGCGVPTPNSHTPGGNQTPYHGMVHTPGGHVHTPGGHVHTPGGSQGLPQHAGAMMGVVGGSAAASMMSGGSMMMGHQQPMMDGRSMGLGPGVSPYVNSMISPHSQQLHHLQQQQLHHHQMQQLHHQQMQQQQQQQQQQQYCPVPSPAGPLHHHHFQQTPNPMMPHTPNNSSQQQQQQQQQLMAAHLPPHATTPMHHQQTPLQQQHQQLQQVIQQQQQQQQQTLQQSQQLQLQQQQQPDPPANQLAHGKDVRHVLYVLHFPVTSGDPCSHENNQRAVVLCGFGRAREEARHAVKKATKEILRLFSKKNCIDAVNGEPNNKVKKKKDKEKIQEQTADSAINMENLFQRFRKLSYHSQHVVTHSVSKGLVDLVSSFASGSSGLLPSVENVSHLFDLLESCFNVSHLLALAIKLLTDIPEVENQLVNKGSVLVGAYTTNLCLCLVGIFRTYQACLLLAQDQTILVFENLCRVVKHVDHPSECSSAERVVLAYLYDLYTSCSFLKVKYADMFGGPCMKVKATIFCEIEPASSNLRWEESFSRDLMENPRRKIDHSFVKQLSEVPADRYSFVCSVLYNVCSCHNVDKVNDIANLCAELTACCNVLSAEWLGVLKALCWSSNHNCGFIDVLTQVDVGDLSIHDSLAVFTAILLARHCFTLDDVIGQVFLQSLLSACPTVGSGGDPDCELGARLTCHLLLRLFQMMTPGSGGGSGVAGNGGGGLGKNGSAMFIKSSRDRHLIETSHKRVNLPALVSVLKAILMLGEYPNADPREIKPGGFAKKSSNILDNLDSPDMSLRMLSRSKSNVENAGLSEYAKYCLKEICQQTWVRESFLREPEDLLTPNLLLDRMLSHKQARHLVHLICRPDGGSHQTPQKGWTNDEDDDDDDSDIIGRVLKNMNQWTLGVSWLELQLMVKQASQLEMGSLLDSIAKGTIDVFQQQNNKDKPQKTPQSQSSQEADDVGNNSNVGAHDSVWFIAPLISKLSPAVQGKILRTAGTVLETGNNFWSAKNSKDKEKYLQKSTSLLGNQPFLCLVLSCLKGQDEQREGLLKSLHDQLEKFVANSKEQERMVPSDEVLQFMMQEALQLRLSLVGSMFDTIQRNNNLVQDWCILLVQLVCCGVVDIQSNGELLTTVIDMLAVLVNGTLAHDNSDKTEEGKKFYQNLMRKLKKELGEKKSPSIDLLRQVLLIPKVYCEIIVSEPVPGADPKGQKSSDHDRGQSLQVTRKERVSPWDIMENQRNPAPLNLSWFGAVRKEKKVLKYEEQHRLLLYHSHSIKKPESYYLEPPILPPEEMEQPPEKPVELKPMEQMFEAKPETSKAKKSGRNRANKKQPQSRPVMAQPPHYMQPGGMPNPAMGFNRPEMYPSTVPVQNWYNGQPYPAQLPPGGNVGRAYPAGTNPRQMLNNVLKTRHPMQQQQQQAFMAAPGVPAQAQQPQNWARQRGAMARGTRLQMDPRAPIFAQPGQQPAGVPMGAQHFAGQPSQAVGYPGYASQAMPGQMEPTAQGVMNQPYQQQGTSVGYAVPGQGPPGQYPQQASSRYGNMAGGGGVPPGYGQIIRGAANPSQPSNFGASAAMQTPHQQRLIRQQLMMQQQQQQQMASQQQHRQGQQNLPFNSFHG